MQPDHTERTFYNYQLLRKVRFSSPIKYFYYGLGLSSIMAATIMDGLTGVIYALIAWMIIQWLLYVVARSIFVIDRYTYKGRWGWRFTYPWVGFHPLEQHFVGLRYWTKILFYSVSIVSVIIVILSIWMPLGLVLQFAFWMIWIITPRLFPTLYILPSTRDGLVKLNHKDFSLYKA
ncbi:hypothetical protein [Paenibacillus sp. 481]|uniref:hypothetical protein n=1 Tax=Paenibacillus sp. 481 TaxID=2835869 RepID=UPI001E622091|nr:hypothetical protein [Paenibacillus sp. 481]UHA75358.1 hypothetical protein KIK04_10320 [Paenibacillus sp. 481]